MVGVHNSLGIMGRSAKDINSCMKHILSNSETEHYAKVDARYAPVQWREEEEEKKNEKLKIAFIDADPCFPTPPGLSRGVRHAVKALRARGHQLVPLDDIDARLMSNASSLAWQMMGAVKIADWVDRDTFVMLDWSVFGLKYLHILTPKFLRKILALIVRPWSPILSKFLSADPKTLASNELWRMNSKRLRLTEKMLARWRDMDIDALITPGMCMLPPKHGWPQFMCSPMSVYAAFNMMNFPAGIVPVSCNGLSMQLPTSI